MTVVSLPIMHGRRQVSGKSINECLDELELSFTNGEIVAFCTVINEVQRRKGY